MRDSLGETVFEIRLCKSLRINERSETKKSHHNECNGTLSSFAKGVYDTRTLVPLYLVPSS
jgi:hypothetical protein